MPGELEIPVDEVTAVERVPGAIRIFDSRGLRIRFADDADAVIFWCWPETRLRVERALEGLGLRIADGGR